MGLRCGRVGAGVGVAIGTRNGIGKGQRGVYSFLNVSPTVLNRTLAHSHRHTRMETSVFVWGAGCEARLKGVPKRGCGKLSISHNI